MYYKDRLPSEDEIESSISDYTNAFHTRINVLGNLDPNFIKYLTYKRRVFGFIKGY